MSEMPEGDSRLGDDALGEDSVFVDSQIEDVLWSMTEDSLPSATYDVLFLLRELAEHRPPCGMEIHSFAYLACLMSVYSGQPAQAWGYFFSAVPPTVPFSPAINEALTRLVSAGYLVEGTRNAGLLRSYLLTEQGGEEIAFLSTLGGLGSRDRYLQAAARTALFTSLSAVVNSLVHEPQLAKALQLHNSRMLLTRASSDALYEEFAALTDALGPSRGDLLVPASLYVRYLQTQAGGNDESGLDEETIA